MSRIRNILSLFVAGALLAAPAPVLAQDGPPPPPPGDNPPTPQQVVEHCVRHLAGITGHTLEVMRASTGRTIEIVGELDANGAPAPVIVRAGAVGKHRVSRALHVGAHAINAETERCLRLLNALGAPPEAARPILEARQRSLQAIREGNARSCEAIVNAVRAAVGGGGDGNAPEESAARSLAG